MGNDEVMRARLWIWAGEVAKVAALTVNRDPYRWDESSSSGAEAESAPRRLRPAGRSANSHVDLDSLRGLYSPQDGDADFYQPVSDWTGMFYAPVRIADQWATPMQPHRIQVVECVREGGRWRYKTKEKRISSGRELLAYSNTEEYRRSRLFETTGRWIRGHVPEGQYRKWVLDAADPTALAGLSRLREPVRTIREVQECATRLIESERGDGGERDSKRTELTESDAFSFGLSDADLGRGSSVTRDIDQEYIPIIGGPYHHQLYLHAHWEMTAKAFYEKNHSELAKAAIAITSDFTLGRGVTWKIRNQITRSVWEEFWKRNRMEERLRRLSDDLTWQGELLIRKFEPLAGFLSIRSVDPSTVWEIVTIPEDIEEVLFYHLSYPTQYQLPYSDLRGTMLNVPNMRYVVTQYPANEVYHVKINVAANEKWGRSDFYSSFGTLKRHRDWVNAATLKDMLQANLIWKIKLAGDDADVDAFMSDSQNAQLPAFGGTWVENGALDLQPMHQDMTSGTRTGQGNTGDFLTALFATSMQMSTTYFNSSAGGASRATALTQGEPHVKRISTRQQVIRRILDHIYEAVMRAAVDSGRISADVIRHEDADPEWVFPSIYEEDRGAKFRDLVTAKGMAAVSHHTVATQMAQELGLAEYDYENEQKDIAKEGDNSFLALWPPHQGATQAATAPSYPNVPVPSVGAWAAAPNGKPGSTQGKPRALSVPNDPMASSAAVASPHEKIAGVGARSQFRAQQLERPSVGVHESHLCEVDRRFTVAALSYGLREVIQLPSGRRLDLHRVHRQLRECNGTRPRLDQPERHGPEWRRAVTDCIHRGGRANDT